MSFLRFQGEKREREREKVFFVIFYLFNDNILNGNEREGEKDSRFQFLFMTSAEEEIRRRLLDVAPEPDESLPFHGRVRLARRKRGDPWYIKAAEVTLFTLVFLLSPSSCLGFCSLSCHWFTLRDILSF